MKKKKTHKFDWILKLYFRNGYKIETTFREKVKIFIFHKCYLINAYCVDNFNTNILLETNKTVTN